MFHCGRFMRGHAHDGSARMALQLVCQARAYRGDARPDVIQLRGQVRELLFDQRRALVSLDGDLSSAPLGDADQLASLIVGLLLGAVKRI